LSGSTTIAALEQRILAAVQDPRGRLLEPSARVMPPDAVSPGASIRPPSGAASAASRQGDGGVCKLPLLGASGCAPPPARATAWQARILARRPVKVAVIAQAARNARIAWVMLPSGTAYRPPVAAAATPAATAA